MLIPTFQRNMPSPYSGLGWEEEDYIGFEVGRVRERVNQNLANLLLWLILNLPLL
jgi:hypothetical protein